MPIPSQLVILKPDRLGMNVRARGLRLRHDYRLFDHLPRLAPATVEEFLDGTREGSESLLRAMRRSSFTMSVPLARMAALRAAGAAGVGAQEAILYGTQETRPLSESVQNIAAATVLSSPMGLEVSGEHSSFIAEMNALYDTSGPAAAALLSEAHAVVRAKEIAALAARYAVPSGVKLFSVWWALSRRSSPQRGCDRCR
jgi:hypothetical protein